MIFKKKLFLEEELFKKINEIHNKYPLPNVSIILISGLCGGHCFTLIWRSSSQLLDSDELWQGALFWSKTKFASA